MNNPLTIKAERINYFKNKHINLANYNTVLVYNFKTRLASLSYLAFTKLILI